MASLAVAWPTLILGTLPVTQTAIGACNQSCRLPVSNTHTCRHRPKPMPGCSAAQAPLKVRRLHSECSMRALLDVILLALNLYVWLLIAAAVLSWLVAFNVVNTRNDFVRAMLDFLYRITEPALRPIRSILPNLGGIDISPIILILIIFFIQRVIETYIYPNVF
jgi:YggT family protein